MFADTDSPTCLTGGYYAIAAMCIDEPKFTHIFKSGEGLSYGEHDSCVFCGEENLFRPVYRANPVSEWLPAQPVAWADMLP